MTVMHTADLSDCDKSDTGVLAAIGISPDEEYVYVYVLEHPGMTTVAISRSLGVARDSAEQVLTSLVDKGLVVEDAGPRPRYRAVAPDVAIEALVAQQQEELARARLAASALRERAQQVASERDSNTDLVETVDGGLATAQRLWQLHVTAAREVVTIGLPSANWSPNGYDDAAELVCLRHGVAHRALYTQDAFTELSTIEALRAYAAAGGDARVSNVPVCMVLVDGTTAVLPMCSGDELAGAVLLRSAPVVSVLSALCELAWAKAVPLSFTQDGAVEPIAADGTRDFVENLVPLLVTGCKDETIARQLGVSTRTLERRVRSLMDGLGANTRFQAGWLAARHNAGSKGDA